MQNQTQATEISTRQVLTGLDALLTALGHETETECELLREHLESARTYLIGSMPAEYQLSLEMASEVLDCIADENLRRRAAAFIQSQRRHEP